IAAPGNEARNLGDIVAEAGRVGIYAGLINHSGTIRVDSAVATEDGRIILKATKNTTVEAGSILSANGPSGGQITIQSGDTTLVDGAISATGSTGEGGTVKVLGNLVGLFDHSKIDVSGETGGGTALVGGDFQGKNPDVQNAFRTWFGPNAKINADASGNGAGGTVIVWSDDATRAYGTISARGGKESGDGGFVEVSGRGWLDFHARVDTSAPKGRTGTLLLDPVDVCIYNNNSGACGAGGASGFFSAGLGSALVFASPGGSGESQFQWGSGGMQSLLTFNNVTITTSNGSLTGTGRINIVEDLDVVNNNGHMLQLVAHTDVNVNGRIWVTNFGEFRVYAGWDEATSPVSALQNSPSAPVAVLPGVGDINVNANIDMHANTLLRAGHDINVANGKMVSVLGDGFSPAPRSLTVHAGNRVNLDHSLLKVDVSGGEGAAATIKILAGLGGVMVNGIQSGGSASILAKGGDFSFFPGGPANIFIGSSEEPILGPVVFTDGAFVTAVGGSFNSVLNGGDARIDVFSNGSITVENNSGLLAQAGHAGVAPGVGGSSLVQLFSNGDINISNANSFGCFACFMPSGVTARAGTGSSGGGSAEAKLSAAGNIIAQNGFLGAEGRGSSLARVTAAANGTVSIGNFSVFMSRGGDDGFPAGGDAQTNVIGNSVAIGGFSTVTAFGGSGTNTGGTASVNIIAAAGQAAAGTSGNVEPAGFLPQGPVTIMGAEGITAFGGSGTNRGGDAFLTIVGGPVTIMDTGPASMGQGVVAFAGHGTGAGSTGGDASTLLVALADANIVRSHVGSSGGSGVAAGGSGTTGVLVGGNLVIDGSGASPSTLFAQGGGSSTGTLGTGEMGLVLFGPTSQLTVNGDLVDVAGGQIGSGPSAVFGPGSINVDFLVRTEGGFSVNGVDGAISGGSGSPPSHGFRVNGQPAVQGTNFFLVYGPLPPALAETPETRPPPAFDSQVISSVLNVIEDLLPRTKNEAPTKEQQEQKKKEREC
ncbi:MAG TPA: hypothetical protein VFC14_20595, partial [Burkholderiales bacterium]|nr:hypothetical protein [Burkholderiales bacterium]